MVMLDSTKQHRGHTGRKERWGSGEKMGDWRKMDVSKVLEGRNRRGKVERKGRLGGKRESVT